MAGAITASRNFTQIIDGAAFNNSDSTTGDTATKASTTLSAAPTGTLSTRTSNTAGTLTMATGHGITTGARLDIYWSGGSCRGATVGTVATNSVPFTGATGTVLPAQDTAITAMVPDEEVFNVVGNNAVVVAAAGDAAFTVVFADGSNVEKHYVVKTAAGAGVWFSGDDATNPLSGDTVTKVFLSHGSSAGSVNVRATVLVN